MNFELKSEEERDALIDAYQSFLNSLPCPIQVVVRTREIDMNKYLEDLSLVLEFEDDEAYRSQLINYSEFVGRLVVSNKILTRRFYIVVPYDAREFNQSDFAIEQLNLSCEIVSRGLGRIGVQTRRLTSVEALDLFYSFYNPTQAKLQPLSALVLQRVKQAII